MMQQNVLIFGECVVVPVFCAFFDFFLIVLFCFVCVCLTKNVTDGIFSCRTVYDDGFLYI